MIKVFNFFTVILLVAINISLTGQNSLDDLNIIFKHDFNNNTLGNYLQEEYKEDWLYPEWNSRQPTTEIVQDKENTTNPSKALKLNFPANSLGSNEGGAYWSTALQPKYSELYVSYDVMFMPGFQYQMGGKLPSVQGGYITANTKPTGYDGFTGGLMFKENGGIVFYIYYADSPREGGITVFWGSKGYNETSFAPSKVNVNYASGDISYANPGTWHNITYRMVLNTVKSGGGGNYDGIMEAYFDGKLVTQVSQILFRHTQDIGIDAMRLYSFFGGSTDDWRNPINEWVNFDNFLLYTFKDEISVPRGNTLSPTDRTINYWRNFDNTTPEPVPVDSSDTTSSLNNIKINFIQDEQIAASSDWNNLITSSNGTIHHLKNGKGQLTDLDLFVASSEIYTSIYGSYPGIYPDEVMRTSWRADNYSTKTIQIMNLDESKIYKFEILGSFSAGDYVTNYTISNITKSLNVANNTHNTVSWIIKPSSNNIDISWSGSSFSYGFLNSLIMTEMNDSELVVNNQPRIQNQTLIVDEINYEAPHLGFVSASDPDQGQVLTYTIISGNDQNLFILDQATGEISTSNNEIFNYEQLQYELVIRVEDNGQEIMDNQAIITIRLVPDPRIVYIDPTNVNDISENGSLEHPFNSWKDITWENGYKYFQKRGTTANEDKISIYCDDATLGSYGEGDFPIIESTSESYAIQALDKDNLYIADIHIIADNAIGGIYLLGNASSEYTIQNCIIENSDNGVRIIEGKQITLKYNTFNNCIMGIYSLATLNNVYYNIFKSNYKAIEIASLTSTTNIYNNVFYENESGVSTSYGYLLLYNNIFYLSKDGDIALNLKLDTFLSDNNIFYPKRDGFIEIADKTYNSLSDFKNDYQIDINSFCKDPQFVDMYNDNFSITQNSPAINAGKVVGLERDYFGVSVPYAGFPDIGISEIISGITSIANNTQDNSDNTFSVYPNPSRGHVNVGIDKTDSSDEQPSILKVIDQTGKTVYSKEIPAKTYGYESIDLSDKINGLYYFLLQTVDKTITEKLLILH